MTRLWNPTRAASSRSSARARASNPASTPVVFPLVSRSMRNPRRAARIISEISSLRCSGQSGGQTDSSTSAGMYCCEAPSPRPGVPVGVVPHQTGRLVKDRWLLVGQGGPDGSCATSAAASELAMRRSRSFQMACQSRSSARRSGRAAPVRGAGRPRGAPEREVQQPVDRWVVHDPVQQFLPPGLAARRPRRPPLARPPRHVPIRRLSSSHDQTSLSASSRSR